MLRPQKEELVSSMQQTLSKASTVVVTQYSGMTVAEMTDLRRFAIKAGAGFKVSKNRLTRIAIKDTPFAAIDPMLKGPTALAYSSDPIAAAKLALDYAKKNDKLIIIGGVMGSTTLDAGGVKAVANLPSLDALRAKIVGLLVAPATKIAGIAQAPAGQLARLIQAKSQQTEAA